MKMAMQGHEVKGNDVEVRSLLTAAYGAGECPKLVGRVKSKDINLRIRALEVLCETLVNPYKVTSCISAGVVPLLNSLAVENDLETRRRATRALAVLARDANGKKSMVECGTAAAVVTTTINDSDDQVRNNLYQALESLSSRGLCGVHALVNSGYATILVEKAAKETSSLQPIALNLLRNCLADQQGLSAALDAKAVETCIAILAQDCSTGSHQTLNEAASTLTTLCFDESAKLTAIECDGIPALLNLLRQNKMNISLSAAVVAALMAITTTDEGKRRLVPKDNPTEATKILLALLYYENASPTLVTNTLKCIANLVVHPMARAQLRSDPDALGVLSDLCNSHNKLIAKHASIAEEAVLWEP